jgi:hypothetical protein
MYQEQILRREQNSTHGKIYVENARYVDGYSLLIEFTDGKQQIVDFSSYLQTSALGYLQKYKDLKYFKKFKIEKGNLVWGRNWDLIFPIHQLYIGKIIA